MSDPAIHIAAWQAAGLIDEPMAQRLREAIGAEPSEAAGPSALTSAQASAPSSAPSSAPPAPRSPTALGAFFGPAVTIGEMFGYLGVGFLLGAWVAFLGRIAGFDNRDAILTLGTAAAAGVMAILGGILAGDDARRRRGAGAALLTAATLVAGAAAFGVQFLGLQGPITGIVIAGLTVAAAAAFRLLLPAVTTQIALLGALTGLTAAILVWLHSLAVGDLGNGPGFSGEPQVEPVGLLFVGAAVWLLAALSMGWLGLNEARHADADRASVRRAAVTRLWAGLVAVIGLWISLSGSGYLGDGAYGRILEPLVADGAVLVLAVILVERAFRRDATAFVAAAAIGLIVALTDFNFTYLSQSTDVGLFFEGAILLVVGLVGDRLRRRLDRGRDAHVVSLDDPLADGVPA
jgi:hypothetical protein